MLSRRDILRWAVQASVGAGVLGRGTRTASAEEPSCTPPSSSGAIPFRPDPQAPLRVRKSIYDLTPAEVERLRRAYAAMRQLTEKDPSDPRGFLQQAQVHCWYCGGGGVEIHDTWFFLPWHRAFLYFHERILGALIGDPTFALPYWDWDAGARRQMPPPYLVPGDTTNPLHDTKRRKTWRAGAPWVEVGPLALKPIMALTEFAEFGGSGPGQSPGGRLEVGPHAHVHKWVGADQEDMGIFRTAARDPIFYPHHAQIDRLWEVWVRAGHDNPTDPSWLEQRWSFFDEKKHLVSISVRDALEAEKNLRYRYAALGKEKPARPPSAKPAPAAPVRGKPGCSSVLGMMFPGPTLLEGQQPVTLRLAIPAGCRVERVRIEGIHLAPTESILVYVFANLPEATADADVEAAAEHFLGYFCIVARIRPEDAAHHLHPGKPINLTFGDAEQLGRLLARGDGKTLAVTLVPIPDEEAPPRRPTLRWDRVMLVGDME